MQAMTTPRSPREGTAPPRWLRGLAVLTAAVVGTGIIGFATTGAGAQSSGGSGNLSTDAIQSSVDPAVAVVNTTLAGGQGEAAGTGMVLSSSGEILTNNHVIENASSVRVQIGGKGRSYTADVLGYNVSEDVALLKVDGVSGLDTVKTDETVSVGEPVVALGNAGDEGARPTPRAVRCAPSGRRSRSPTRPAPRRCGTSFRSTPPSSLGTPVARSSTPTARWSA